METKNKRIAIIGAGPCGIVSGKTALECGFDVVVFDKNENIGGVWSIGNGGKAWDNMKTHISYVSMMFSDYFWNVPDEKKPFYPTREEMYQYFIDYCKHFNLYDKIKLKTKVIQVEQLKEDKKWLIRWCGSSEYNNFKEEVFDFVIISTGLFSKKKDINKFGNFDNFKGRVTTSEQYKNPTPFINKRTLIVGGSSSGIEIASDIANVAKSVYVSCKRNKYVIKRAFPNKNNNIPVLDHCIESREIASKKIHESDIESNIAASNFFNMITCNQKENKYFKVSTPDYCSQYCVVSNDFLDLLKTGKIKVTDKLFNSCSGNNVLLSKNNSLETIEVDEIICCDGYDVDFSFFNQDIKNLISLDCSYPHLPVLLYNHTFSPELDNIAFIGIFRSPVMVEMEIQARWVIYCFANIINLPSKQKMLDGIKYEEKIRNLNNEDTRPQFVNKSTARWCDELATAIGCLPDFDQLKISDPYLYNILWNKMIHPSGYRLKGPFSNKDESEFHIKNDFNHYFN